ncbi:hypothetical protein PQQ51_04150 [Paraburkholderia xenovorans]|uniref:hypothetical protein n=1 Tax=Paraburkholderia xenovorans TaxID=36873 RepID=UPI0038B97B79
MNKVSAALSKATHINGNLLQPILTTSSTRNGRTRIHFGDRKFFSGTVTIERDGQPPKRIQVIAERGFQGDDMKKSRQAFYPLDNNLLPDTSTRLYKKPDGEWGIAEQKQDDPSAHWLPANAFDKIAKDGFKSGFHRVGNREFCVAPTMQHSKMSKQSKPVLIECLRGATPGEDRYCSVNADLSEGGAVKLPADMASADPFIGQISSRIGAMSWTNADGSQPARAAAISAFRGGASVVDAIALGQDLTLRAKVNLDGDSSTYAAAGASAGILLRAGVAQDTANQTAQTVIRMAETMQAAAGNPTPPVDPTTLPPGPQRQYGILKESYDKAAAGFGDTKRQLRDMDRSALGADLTGLTAAARQLFIEKRYKPNELADVAKGSADRSVAQLRKAVDHTETQVVATRNALLAAEAVIADLEAQLAHHAHRQGNANATSGTRFGASLFSSRRGDATNASHPDANVIAIERHLTLAKAKLSETERTHQTALQARSLAVRDLDGAGRNRNARLDVAVKALLAAHTAAPNDQNIALAAARAASETFHEPGDEQKAECAAATAHLAMLAGASENDAMAAAHLIAGTFDTGAASFNTTDLHTMQVAYAQIASASGRAPTDDAQLRPQVLAATAAIDTLGRTGTNANNVTVARLMGKLVSDAKPLPAQQQTAPAPLFQFDESPPAKTGARPKLSAIPEHYEPVESELDADKAPFVQEWGHAKIRQVENLGINQGAGSATTTYLVQMKGPKGMMWSDFAWSPNANQLYGEIPVKPRNAQAGQTAGHAKVLVAFNGITGEWESFEQRSRDLLAKTTATFKEIEQVVKSRDDRLGFMRLPYRGKESGYVQNVLDHFKTQAEEEIRLFVQGRRSQPAFKSKMATLFIDLSTKLEGDRSRKKAIIRHQIDSLMRLATIAVGASFGGARVAAAFE